MKLAVLGGGIALVAMLCALAPATAQGQAGYSMVGEPVQISNGLRVNLAKSGASGSWEGEAETLTLDAEFQSDYRLRVKIYNSTERHEVPLNIQPATGGNNNPLFEIQFSSDPLFSFKVVRRSTGTVVFDTSPGDFIFADQYLTLSWTPASENVYGIGENEQPTFKHDFSRNLSWALWARDQPPEFTKNMYGVHPYYTALENDGNAHSVVIVNSNLQQFTMSSGPLIQYITTGGLLDLYFFFGPTPEDVVKQYTEAVGRPEMPPYWALGFQLCRFGYDTIENMKATVERNAFYGIPQDVQYGDIDIMHKNLDFTYSRERFDGLPEYIRELKAKGVKFVTIVDPAISIGEVDYRPFDLGNEMDVWVKKPDGTPYEGRVWPEDPVYFPDFSKNATREYWVTLIKEFHDLLEYDGLWIDMNEPANFGSEECSNNNLNNPPFIPNIVDQSLKSNTICADSVQEAGNHYDVHSLYGWFQSEPTLRGAREGTGKRSLVLTRSSFLGSGHWVAHWLGDNWSRWSNLHFSIIGMLQFNQFGIPLVGADICGFLENSNEEMCQRWQELGAFYPFSRNHNVAGVRDQDPAVWGPAVAESTRKALLIRYTLLPYLYLLFFRAHNVGGTVVRALWHNYPTDQVARDIDRQFMWGNGLMVVPVLEEGKTEVEAYFPNDRFYDYYDGGEVTVKGNWTVLHAPLDKINLFVAGGSVLITQEPAVTTALARNNPFGLIVALSGEGTARGYIYWDDGDSIATVENEEYFRATFDVANNMLYSTINMDNYPLPSTVSTIRLMGQGGNVTTVNVNGEDHDSFTNFASGEVLISNLSLDISTPIIVRWS